MWIDKCDWPVGLGNLPGDACVYNNVGHKRPPTPLYVVLATAQPLIRLGNHPPAQRLLPREHALPRLLWLVDRDAAHGQLHRFDLFVHSRLVDEVAMGEAAADFFLAG